MYIQCKHKNWGELLLSQNGVCGTVFYLALVGGAAAQVGFGIPVFSRMYVICLILIPLVLIFLKEPIEQRMEGKKMFPDGFGAFATQSFFELFEVCLSFITNTISYLRVGGFVLSHAGMMLVVTLLMDMTSGAGSIVVAIFGNLFVMCLEGMIVGIQVLRLEFYEMFSRYFSGDGITAKSAKIRVVSHIALFFLVLAGVLVYNINGVTALAAEGEVVDQMSGSLAQGLGFIAAALATGLSALGAGIAVAAAAPAAIGAFSENDKNFGKSLIFVALGEGVALYGMLISILIISKIG